MRQLIVTGKVTKIDPSVPAQNAQEGFIVSMEEKIWDGQKEVVVLWEIHLDKYQGERLKKAMFQIKYFGFVCDAFRMDYEWQGEKRGMIIWYSARAQKFFTL